MNTSQIHNDGILILDELSQMDPKNAGESAYLLANGQGKTRASREGTAKKTMQWSLLFLSAGEETLASLMAKAGLRCNAGQEIRLADIEADAGSQMGVFEELHEHTSPAQLALQLKEAAQQTYGVLGQAWLEKIVEHRPRLESYLTKEMQQFVNEVTEPNHSGQIQRVTRRFALVAVAGELASRFNLTGWPQGTAIAASKSCFYAWLNDFGSQGNREDRVIFSQVRAFFESYGASRFDSCREPNNQNIHNRAGFYFVDDQGFRVYMVLSEVYKKEICLGLDPKMVTKVLLNAGWIKPGNDGKASQKPRIRGVGTLRCYVFTERLWSDEYTEQET